MLILNLLYTLFDFVGFLLLAASDDVACFVCHARSFRHALTVNLSRALCHIIYSGTSLYGHLTSKPTSPLQSVSVTHVQRIGHWSL